MATQKYNHRHQMRRDLAKNKELISHEELLEILKYEPETGHFTWKVNDGGHRQIGLRAGAGKSGHHERYITLDYKAYNETVLAWFYAHKGWLLSRQIYHKNGDRCDRRIENLTDQFSEAGYAKRVVPISVKRETETPISDELLLDTKALLKMHIDKLSLTKTLEVLNVVLRLT